MSEKKDIIFRCHHCARKIEVGAKFVSHTVKCPKCESVNVVPDPKSPSEFARNKEHAELKKIYAIRDQGKMSDAEFEAVTRKVYELPWGAPPDSVKKGDLKAAPPQFGGAAAEGMMKAEKSGQEDADFHAWLQKATEMVEDDQPAAPGGGTHKSQTFDGIDFKCRHCFEPISAPMSLIGQECTCPACHKTNIVPLPEEAEAAKKEELNEATGSFELQDDAPEIAPVSTPDPAVHPPAGVPEPKGNKQYKIITQDDDLLGGRFDPVSVEKALNAYHSAGWRVVTATNAMFMNETHQKVMFILERED